MLRINVSFGCTNDQITIKCEKRFFNLSLKIRLKSTSYVGGVSSQLQEWFLGLLVFDPYFQ